MNRERFFALAAGNVSNGIVRWTKSILFRVSITPAARSDYSSGRDAYTYVCIREDPGHRDDNRARVRDARVLEDLLLLLFTRDIRYFTWDAINRTSTSLVRVSLSAAAVYSGSVARHDTLFR